MEYICFTKELQIFFSRKRCTSLRDPRRNCMVTPHSFCPLTIKLKILSISICHRSEPVRNPFSYQWTRWMQCIVGQAWVSCMVHGALVFYRKYLGKRLGHQMYMWRNVAWVSSLLGFIVHSSLCCMVSLITEVGYRVEQWGGKWDGTMGIANSHNWRCCSRLC